MLSARDIATWCDPSQETAISYSDSMYFFHLLGPRARFMQGLPQGATILDAGAGDGALVGLRAWLMPHRSDLALYGLAMRLLASPGSWSTKSVGGRTMFPISAGDSSMP